MSDPIKAAAESIVRQWDEHDRFRVCAGESDEEPAEVAVARAYLALGERQEDRWTHQRDSDGALSMFMYSTPQAAANSFHAEKGGRIVRVSTFIREDGEDSQ